MANTSKGFARVEIFEEYMIVPTAGGFVTCTSPDQLWRVLQGEKPARIASNKPIRRTETVDEFKARGGRVQQLTNITLDDLDL